MLIFENISLALSSIRVNKMRSFLTMLGMIIGISSVISIVSLGDTMRNVIATEFENIGTTLAYSYIMSESDYYTSNETYSYEDIENMRYYRFSIDLFRRWWLHEHFVFELELSTFKKRVNYEN